MVSNGKEFRIYIPSKNSFLVGPTTLIRPSNKPIENLRPQHIVEALFWPELHPGAKVLFEQFDFDMDRYYILTVLRDLAGGKLEIARKIWFDRADLQVSRVQLFGPAGCSNPISNIRTGNPFRSAQRRGAMGARPSSFRAIFISGARRTITNSRSAS